MFTELVRTNEHTHAHTHTMNSFEINQDPLTSCTSTLKHFSISITTKWKKLWTSAIKAHSSYTKLVRPRGLALPDHRLITMKLATSLCWNPFSTLQHTYFNTASYHQRTHNVASLLFNTLVLITCLLNLISLSGSCLCLVHSLLAVQEHLNCLSYPSMKSYGTWA